MFDQTFVDTQAQTRRPWTVAISLALQTALVAIALILPLLRIRPLEPPRKIPVWVPLENLDLRLRPAAKAAVDQTSSVHRPVFRLAALRPSITVPTQIDLSPDAPAIDVSPPTTGLAGPPAAFSLPEPVVPPAPQPRPVPPSAPVRVGSGVQSAKLSFGPKPAYPRLAIAARTQGTVIIQALIGRDGVIGNLRVLSGPSILVAAAIEAVRQWRYQPTLLNGEPVEVITEIDVNFTLGK